MKILIHSSVFFPSTGGIESFVLTVAQEFVNRGHSVKIITGTASSQETIFPFEVYRLPGRNTIKSLMQWCDICFCNSISLKFILPILYWRNKIVVTHHTWYKSAKFKLPQDYLKLALTLIVTNVSISKAIAKSIPAKSTLIPNPYQDHLFHYLDTTQHNYDLVYLGRLVSEKGVDLLINALKILKEQNIFPSCIIIGDGPEMNNLTQLVQDNQLSNQVTFIGKLSGIPLTNLLNKCRIMVLPTRVNETFGIAALEGIACGCIVVGSEGGGLKDAIGPCGITFPNGDVKALADRLKYLLNDNEVFKRFQENASDHLERHKQKAIAAQYLKVFEENSKHQKLIQR